MPSGHQSSPAGARGLGKDPEAAVQKRGRTEHDSGMEGSGPGNGSKTESRGERALSRGNAPAAGTQAPHESPDTVESPSGNIHMHGNFRISFLEFLDAQKNSLDLKLISPEELALLNQLRNQLGKQ